ncbi:MAG: hypothetical protein MK193_01835 [Lentisphaeria bacterium]|nr:hypothetical protein [Lentisphaeria bacterium]
MKGFIATFLLSFLIHFNGLAQQKLSNKDLIGWWKSSLEKSNEFNTSTKAHVSEFDFMFGQRFYHYRADGLLEIYLEEIDGSLNLIKALSYDIALQSMKQMVISLHYQNVDYDIFQTKYFVSKDIFWIGLCSDYTDNHAREYFERIEQPAKYRRDLVPVAKQ